MRTSAGKNMGPKQMLTCKESAPLAFLDVAASAAAQSASSSSAAVLSAGLLLGLLGLALALQLSAAIPEPLALAALLGLAVDGGLLPESFKGCRGQYGGSGDICIGLYFGVRDAERALVACADCGDGVSALSASVCLPLDLSSACGVTCIYPAMPSGQRHALRSSFA